MYLYIIQLNYLDKNKQHERLLFMRLPENGTGVEEEESVMWLATLNKISWRLRLLLPGLSKQFIF